MSASKEYKEKPGILPKEETAPSALALLIGECMRGNRKAQKDLYEQYAPLVFGIIRRYVSETVHAQEILNDAFFRIFQKLEQYTFQGAFEGWIRRIAVTQISDHFRKKINHADAGVVTIEEYHAYVDNDITSKLNFQELLKLVHELPDTHRAVFNLYVFENCTHKEIAALLDISDNNSRWHLNDARRRLKEKILLTRLNDR